jgi:hypothetical protein
MSHIFNRTHFAGFILLVGIILGVLGLFIQLASAQVLPAQPAPTGLPVTPFDLEGYLWSSTIGWVSLNCRTGGATGNNVCATSNYKVRVLANGNLDGFAWSSNVGWIKFGGLGATAPLNSFPTENGNTRLDAMMSGSYSSMKLYGWARACAGTLGGDCSSMNNSNVSGSWDGWISLRGNKTTVPAYSYGITTNRTVTTGAGVASTSFAWGSTVVGWIGFDLMRLVLPTATLTGTGCNIGFASTTCGARLDWTFGSNPLVSSRNVQKVSPVAAVISGSAPVSGFATVTLSIGSNDFEARTGSTELADISLTASCSSPNAFYTPPGVCDQLPPIVTIDASKRLIRIGEMVNITWTITPPGTATSLSPNTQCRVYGPGMPTTLLPMTSGTSDMSLPIANGTQFKVACTGTFSSSTTPPPSIAEDTVTVEVIPTTQEI